MPATSAVTVVGSINYDILVNCPTLPGAGETVGGGSVSYAWGGKGANQAVAAAVMAPNHIAMLAAVGDDALGQSALKNLEQSYVDATLVRELDGHATGQAFVMIGDSGENQIVVCPGANATFDAAHIPARLDCRVVSLCAEVGDAALVAAVAACGDAQVVYNVAPPRPVPAAILAARPILIVNEHEAVSLTNCKNISDALATLRTLSDNDVVVTLGAIGVMYSAEGDVWRQASASVRVVDTTGAGDAFCGAFVAAIADGESIHNAVRHGVALGALACTRLGARTDWVKRADVLQLADSLESPQNGH